MQQWRWERRVILVVVMGLLGALPMLAPDVASAAVGSGGFVGLTPSRVLDTRNVGEGPCLSAGVPRSLLVAGRVGVPSDAAAVVLNVTVTAPTGSGYLTVYPAGVARPLASSLNFVPGQTVPNAVTVKVGAGGQVVAFNSSGCAHVVVDVVGYYRGGGATAAGGFVGTTPTRFLDTRVAGQGPCLPAGTPRSLLVAGVGGVPADASAVVLNVTVTEPTAGGFLTLYPTGVSQPLASNLNFVAGQTVPNAVTVKVGAGGQVDLFNSAGCTHAVVDVVGYFTGGAPVAEGGFVGITPTRARDTRVDGFWWCLEAGDTLSVAPFMDAQIPVNATAVVLNVTVTEPTEPGFLTVFPGGVGPPLASNLNFVPGQTVPNAVTVKVGAGGEVDVLNSSGCAHVIVDVVGYFAGPPLTELAGVTSMAAGDLETCAVVSGGEVACWGWGYPAAARVEGLANITHVASGQAHTCARATDGTVSCWGSNELGQLGNPEVELGTSTPTPVPGLDDALSVAAGDLHTCALRVGGSVACWGFNEYGQAGGADRTAMAPVSVPSIDDAVQVDAGWSHSCARIADGTVECWGDNNRGQLGIGDIGVPISREPLTAVNLSGVVEIAAGSGHTCARLTGGVVKCWGRNDDGQVGKGTTGGGQREPVQVALPAATSIAAGGFTSCATLADSSARCWGANDYGQLGNGTLQSTPLPVAVSSLTGATSIRASRFHTCAVMASGTAKCWGSNAVGQLGTGQLSDDPVTIPASVVR